MFELFIMHKFETMRKQMNARKLDKKYDDGMN